MVQSLNFKQFGHLVGNYLGNWFKTTVFWSYHECGEYQSTRMNEFLLVLYGSPTHLLLFPSEVGTLSTSGVVMSLSYLLPHVRQRRPKDHPA